ncbi:MULTISPECIES: cell division protein FtsL [Photobacterium]|jgi:cell division protein FtsL|uniref:Cell division protein FtsL n=2 Tax=Photobacterium TaxID=657 RepID=A0A2N4UT91_9GAMM|nr:MULTISPECIES: cell division protein FtsL [Photobacterium]KAE8176711.1 cell division protein FtsL [Photobacterium carnosum]KJF87709.1 cell division protein FtsL [Photobacterium phosphoreum]MBY3788483.1 cell division protein FtsL [Photobacterium carnosum]MCD9464316.1 cell division protein FtsL [Photobacterium phosphoreum]MCD9472293.1 cell division protein FtsL [Photobacterium phosphoreum]
MKPTESSMNLASLIGRDLVTVGLVPLILAFAILLSALSVVYVTHESRQLIAQQEKLLMQRENYDVEWRNQILEENSLAEHSRIERLAETELKMQRPSVDNEIVIH